MTFKHIKVSEGRGRFTLQICLVRVFFGQEKQWEVFYFSLKKKKNPSIPFFGI